MKLKEFVLIMNLLSSFSLFGNNTLDTIIKQTPKVSQPFIISGYDLINLGKSEFGYPLRQSFIEDKLSPWLKLDNPSEWKFSSIGYFEVDSIHSYLIIYIKLKNNNVGARAFSLLINKQERCITDMLSIAGHKSTIFGYASFINDGKIARFHIGRNRYSYYEPRDTLWYKIDKPSLEFPFRSYSDFINVDTQMVNYEMIADGLNLFPYTKIIEYNKEFSSKVFRVVGEVSGNSVDSCQGYFLTSHTTSDGTFYCFFLVNYYLETNEQFSGVSLGIYEEDGDLKRTTSFTKFNDGIRSQSKFDHFELYRSSKSIKVKTCQDGYCWNESFP